MKKPVDESIQKQLNEAFNRGLRTSILILEMAEKMTPEGRRTLIEQLKILIPQQSETEIEPQEGDKAERPSMGEVGALQKV